MSTIVKSGYTLDQFGRAIHLLRVGAENPSRSLSDNNRAVYSLLRYGVPVKIEAGIKRKANPRRIQWRRQGSRLIDLGAFSAAPFP